MSLKVRIYEDEVRDNLPTNAMKADPKTPVYASNTYLLTKEDMAKGFIITNNSTTAGTLYTPSAKDIVTYFRLKKGEGLRLVVRNIGSSSGAITLTAGTGVTVSGAVIAVTAIREFLFVATNVNPGSEAVTAYGLATSAY